jgi:hypothetical protein
VTPFQIILGGAVPDLGRGRPDHRVQICVVAGVSPENLDPQNPLFELATPARECLLNDVFQEIRITFAAGKQMA